MNLKRAVLMATVAALACDEVEELLGRELTEPERDHIVDALTVPLRAVWIDGGNTVADKVRDLVKSDVAVGWTGDKACPGRDADHVHLSRDIDTSIYA